MEFYCSLLDRRYKLFACLLIICMCHYLVESHVYHNRVLHPNKARDVPDGFVEVGVHNIQLYLYEIMSCYADKGYPCKTNPAFIGHHVKCLSKDKVCDGIKQCPFGDDENGRCGERSHFCESNQVRCVDNGRCATICDGQPECKYAADENTCNEFPCGENQVLCSDGKCAGLCDGIEECESGKDEKDCLPKCDVGEMICPSSGMCAKYCNNVPECEGGEDEIFCTECPEQQDIPCDMVRLSNCFYSGYCRVNNPMRGCDNQQRRQRVSWLLMPCAGETIQAEIAGIPKHLLGCKYRQTLAECMCAYDAQPPGVFGETFESCLPVMFDILGDCDFLE